MLLLFVVDVARCGFSGKPNSPLLPSFDRLGSQKPTSPQLLANVAPVTASEAFPCRTAVAFKDAQGRITVVMNDATRGPVSAVPTTAEHAREVGGGHHGRSSTRRISSARPKGPDAWARLSCCAVRPALIRHQAAARRAGITFQGTVAAS